MQTLNRSTKLVATMGQSASHQGPVDWGDRLIQVREKCWRVASLYFFGISESHNRASLLLKAAATGIPPAAWLDLLITSCLKQSFKHHHLPPSFTDWHMTNSMPCACCPLQVHGPRGVQARAVQPQG